MYMCKNLFTTLAYNSIIINNNNNDTCNDNIVMLRIMKISNFFRIFVYKQTGNWVTIALTSCVDQQNKKSGHRTRDQQQV